MPIASQTAARPVVALVGAGHAHLHVAARAKEFADAGVDLVLLDPGRFWYSSMATGMLGGEYEAEDDSLDPHALIAAHGGRSLKAKAVAIDRERRMLRLEGGGEQPYDVVSLNVGSTVPANLIDGNASNVWAAKPIARLLELRRTIEATWETDPANVPRIVVVGLGLGGMELALNLKALAWRRGRDIAVRVLAGGPKRTSPVKRFVVLLEERAVDVELEASVERIADGAAVLDDGTARPFDHAVLATGLEASPLVTSLGLPCDPVDGLKVTTQLHSPDDERVFAAGDCSAIIGHPRPKVGVFGVRAAPYLAHNLLATATGGTLKTYTPQRRWLWVANLGDGTGLAGWGGEIGTAPGAWRGPNLMVRSRASLRIKETIDARFMDQYRN